MASIKLKGDTSGEVTIQAPAVAGTTTLNLPATSSTLATQNALGVRNLIINGDMRIAQRGTSATGVTTSGYNTVDRWRVTKSTAGTWTHSQDTDVPTGQGFTNSHKLLCTTANSSLSASSSIQYQQKFEGQMLQHLKYGTSSAESLTLSMWLKSNKTGTYVVRLYQAGNSRAIHKSFTIDTADTWEKKTLTFTGDTTGVLANDNSTELEVNLWLVAGSNFTSGTQDGDSWVSYTASNSAVDLTVNLADAVNNYINITGVQLEVGDTATPFEHRPYDMELRRCWRYFYSGYAAGEYPGQAGASVSFQHGSSASGTWCGIVVAPFPTQMRATPTVTAYSPNSGASGKWYSNNTGTDQTANASGTTNGFKVSCQGNSPSAPNGMQVNFTASAEL
jgi:hypothetical protein